MVEGKGQQIAERAGVNIGETGQSTGQVGWVVMGAEQAAEMGIE